MRKQTQHTTLSQQQTPQHGPKCVLPAALVKLLAKAIFAGREIKGDITRLQRVFGMNDLFERVRCFDIDCLHCVTLSQQQTPQHGPKCVLPVASVKLLAKVIFAGREIKGDITRLQRVFGMNDLFERVRCFDIDCFHCVRDYQTKSRASGLSDYLCRETGYVLPDKKGNQTLRTKGWNTSEVLTEPTHSTYK